VLVYGVVSAETEQAVELFLEREQAEAFIAEVEQDEPETAALLRVETIEADGFSASTCSQSSWGGPLESAPADEFCERRGGLALPAPSKRRQRGSHARSAGAADASR
jgi:hypothetical protein